MAAKSFHPELDAAFDAAEAGPLELNAKDVRGVVMTLERFKQMVAPLGGEIDDVRYLEIEREDKQTMVLVQSDDYALILDALQVVSPMSAEDFDLD